MNAFTFDSLSQGVAGYQVAGRLALDVIGLLRPITQPSGKSGIRLLSFDDPAGLDNVGRLFDGDAPSAVPRGDLRHIVLVVRPNGAFFSTDTLLVKELEMRDDVMQIETVIGRTENPNLDPAPRDLILLVSLGSDHPSAKRIVFEFSIDARDVAGKERSDALPAIPAESIDISG